MSEHSSDDETRRIYDRAGFGGPVRRGQRPALLVVDFSVGFTDPQYATGSNLDSEVQGTARLADAARKAGVPVIFTTIAYAANGIDGNAWLAKAPSLAILEAGTPLVEIDQRLNPGERDTIVVKKAASAFFGTNLAAILAGQGVDTVIICGATTSGCVRASAVDSVSSGYPTLVVRDCVGDRAKGPHDANLFDLQAKYADVIELDDALAYVRGARRTHDGVPA